jgi:hypothetical protein
MKFNTLNNNNNNNNNNSSSSNNNDDDGGDDGGDDDDDDGGGDDDDDNNNISHYGLCPIGNLVISGRDTKSFSPVQLPDIGTVKTRE